MEKILGKVEFHLCDLNEDIVKSWREDFGDFSNFQITRGNIIDEYNKLKNDGNDIAIVSPANSFGDMQGGIDLVYFTHFGFQLEENVIHEIQEKKYDELVVGDSIVVNINNSDLLIVAPTMRVPMCIKNTVNVYLAFRSVLITIIKFNKTCINRIKHVLIPGMGTGIGNLVPEVCSTQMYKAYQSIVSPNRYPDLVQMTKEHLSMINNLD
jgi:O-acetyl-ADP-ribose deacetylase (regulator of RNase III)